MEKAIFYPPSSIFHPPSSIFHLLFFNSGAIVHYVESRGKGFSGFLLLRGIISRIMTTIRTFVAIELTDEAQSALLRLQSRLKPLAPAHSVRWTAIQNIHLTLHFLGDVSTDTVEKIAEALNNTASAYRPFSLTLGRLGCFPNTRRPRIIWAGVMGETNILESLQRNLGASLQQTIDFAPDARPYSPHLTIGRVNKGIPSRLMLQLGQALEQERPNIGRIADLRVTEISLMRSELKSTGAVYTSLFQALLKE